jgi:hypothetical protein
MASTITAGTTSGTALNFAGDTSGILTVQGVTMGSGGIGSGNATRFKNRIINGNMAIDQRNGGASLTPTSNGQYSLDRWSCSLSQASKYSVQQNAGSLTPVATTGFTNYLGVTSLSSYSINSTDFFIIRQAIEGLNIPDLAWGTASAKTITLSFWAYSSLTGTFGGALSNSAENRSYPFTYSIPVANTWTQISVTVAGDTTGTWLTTNGMGIRLNIGLGVGTTNSGTAGSWAAAAYYSATGAVSVVGTNAATLYITGVQLEVGSSATGFEVVDYTTQLIMCQRYYQNSYQLYDLLVRNQAAATQLRLTIIFPVYMRTSPTFTGYYANSSGPSASPLLSGVWIADNSNATNYLNQSGANGLSWIATAEL